MQCLRSLQANASEGRRDLSVHRIRNVAAVLADRCVSKLVKFLPKPGHWMDTFKHLMGFVLLGTVILLFSNLEPKYFLATLTFIFGLWFAFWWIGRVPVYEALANGSSHGEAARWFATIVGWFGYAYLVNEPSKHAAIGKPIRIASSEAARQAKQTVIVDFTANWCQTCKFNLYTAIDTPEVKQRVDEYNILALKADQTHDNKENDELLDQLKRESIPVFVVFPGNDPLKPIIFDDLITKSQVLESLEKAGRSAGTVPLTKPHRQSQLKNRLLQMSNR